MVSPNECFAGVIRVQQGNKRACDCNHPQKKHKALSSKHETSKNASIRQTETTKRVSYFQLGFLRASDSGFQPSPLLHRLHDERDGR
jgi:hypothetical protein